MPRLFELRYSTPEEGVCVQWFAAEGLARQIGTDLSEQGITSAIYTVEFPSKKNDVIKWLNRRFNRDNG